MKFALDVERSGECSLIQHAQPADPPGLLEGVLPRTLQLHDLGAVHQADALVRDHVPLTLAPKRQRRGPLPRASQLVHALTDLDRAAVEDPGHDRRELAARDRHHALVHESEALAGSPQFDERVSLIHHTHCNQVAIAKALAYLDRLRGSIVGCLEVAFSETPEHVREAKVAARGAVTMLAIEESLSPCEPPRRRCRLAPKEQTQTDPPRAAGCARHVPGVQMAVVSALEPPLVVVVPAEHVRSRGEELQINGFERPCFVGSCQ